MRRAVVTGAGGFVGAHLARALVRRGVDVHAVVRPGGETSRLHGVATTLHAADVADAAALRRALDAARPDVVFSAAATRADASAAGVERMRHTNVVGVATLLEEARRVGYERLVHLGSSLEYGFCERPMREHDPPAPRSPYGETKAEATAACLAEARDRGQPVVVLRPFNVYGPLDRPHRFVPTAIRAILAGRPLPLTEPGYHRDWIYVSDVVQACLVAAVSDVSGEIVNVATGVETTNERVLEILEHLSGRAAVVEPGAHESRPWDTASWVADTTKARRLLGWAARTTLEEGLAQTLAAARHQSVAAIAG